jgi:hypothetical protein
VVQKVQAIYDEHTSQQISITTLVEWEFARQHKSQTRNQYFQPKTPIKALFELAVGAIALLSGAYENIFRQRYKTEDGVVDHIIVQNRSNIALMMYLRAARTPILKILV